jgi:hypothetical protein
MAAVRRPAGRARATTAAGRVASFDRVVHRLTEAPAGADQSLGAGVRSPPQLAVRTHDRKEDHGAAFAKGIEQAERARLGADRDICRNLGYLAEAVEDVGGDLLGSRSQPGRGQRRAGGQEPTPPGRLLGFLWHPG